MISSNCWGKKKKRTVDGISTPSKSCTHPNKEPPSSVPKRAQQVVNQHNKLSSKSQPQQPIHTTPPTPPPLLLFFCALRLPRFYGGLTAGALEALILGDPSASRGEETRPWGERGASEGTPSTLPKRTPLPSPPARLPGASHPPAPSRVPSEQPSLLLPGLSGCGRPGPRGAGPTAPHPRSRALRRVCGGAGRSERGRGGPTHHGGGGEDAGGGVGPRNGRHLQVLLPEGLVRHLSASRAASASATPLRLRASPTAPLHPPPPTPGGTNRRRQRPGCRAALSLAEQRGRQPAPLAFPASEGWSA